MKNDRRFLSRILFCLLLFLLNTHTSHGAVGKPPPVYELLEKGIQSCRKGDIDQGIQYFNSALKMDPDNYFAYLNRAIAYKDKNLYEKAMSDLKKCTQLRSQIPETYFQLGSVYSNQAVYEKAILFYSRTITIDPDFIKAYAARAIIHSVMGNLSDAIDDINDAISIDPGFPMLYIIRGEVLTMKGECRAALSDFEKAMAFDPENFNTNADIAWILATCPDSEYRNGAKAFKLAKQELTTRKNHENFKILAAAYAEMGNFKQASLFQEKAIKKIKQITPEHEFEKMSIQKDLENYKAQLRSYQNNAPWHERP